MDKTLTLQAGSSVLGGVSCTALTALTALTQPHSRVSKSAEGDKLAGRWCCAQIADQIGLEAEREGLGASLKISKKNVRKTLRIQLRAEFLPLKQESTE